MQPLLPNHERARNLLIAFRLLAVATVVLCISIVYAYKNSAEKRFYGVEIVPKTPLWENFLGLSALLYGVMMVVSIVLFCMWFYRAYVNVSRIGEDIIASYRPHWAVTSWFVPIVNLFRPYQIMREIWTEMQWNTPGKSQEDIKSDDILSAWWALWIIANVVSRFTREGDIDPALAITRAQVILALVSYGLTLAALFLAIKVVEQASKFESELYEARYETDLSDHLITP